MDHSGEEPHKGGHLIPVECLASWRSLLLRERGSEALPPAELRPLQFASLTSPDHGLLFTLTPSVLETVIVHLNRFSVETGTFPPLAEVRSWYSVGGGTGG